MNKYELPDLPYGYDALAPVISEEIMRLHHGKHHQGYVDNANKAKEKIEALNDDYSSIKSLLKDLSFNLNGHLLHSLFWKNMREPVENNTPPSDLETLLSKRFGSLNRFRELFSSAGKSVEGSGWVALLQDENSDLEIMQIENHNKLVLNGYNPVLVIDVWEHAYYLDYQNKRDEFINQWWKIVNWDNVMSNLKT